MKVSLWCVFALTLVGAVLTAEEDATKQTLKTDNATTKATEKSDENPSKSEKIETPPALNRTDEEKPSTSKSTSEDDPTTKAPLSDAERCSQMIGRFFDGEFQGLVVEYDGQKLLEKYGGAPGKVNATWTEREDAPVEEKDLEKRPLPDADEKHWVYRYGESDSKTYIRIEHAFRRFSGTPKAYLEIRGQLYFTPADFCGDARHAYYWLDDRGFTFDVSHEYCWIGSIVGCANPAHCTTHDDGDITCVAAPSNALLASLLGGGK